jgi:ankyrin repeat protein
LVDLAVAGKVDQLKLLIATGVDVNGLDPWGDTALMAAARFGRVEVIQALLAAGADPNLPGEDYDGAISYSPIMNATTDRHSNQCVECINLLLAAGADMNQTTAEGVTALMAALIYPNLPALRRLLEAGAKVHLKNHEGKTALDIALSESEQMSGFDEAIALLKAAELSEGKL